MINKYRLALYLALVSLLTACQLHDTRTQPSRHLGNRPGESLLTAEASQASGVLTATGLTSAATESGANPAPATATVVPTVRPASGAPSPATKIPAPAAPAAATTSPNGGEQPVVGASPQIIAFTASPGRVTTGETVTLSWESIGSSAEMGECLLPDDGHLSHPCSPSEYVPVLLVGTRTVTVPEDARYHADFILVVKGSTENQPAANKYQTLSLEVTCPTTWFFGAAPETDSSCPKDEVVTSAAAWQTLEHGSMMWKESTHDILVLFDDGHLGGGRDQWDSSMPESDPSIVPPNGLYQPVRGFGLIWQGLKDTLGWATGPEVSFQVVYQCSVYRWHESNCYYRDSKGRIIGTDFLGGWRVVKQ